MSVIEPAYGALISVDVRYVGRRKLHDMTGAAEFGGKGVAAVGQNVDEADFSALRGKFTHQTFADA